ncbi:MAG: hypothetical protein OXR67_08075 [Chloroflexota bacterium]|nr:hypothetical protein [Chloroflexota bacterium]
MATERLNYGRSDTAPGYSDYRLDSQEAEDARVEAVAAALEVYGSGQELLRKQRLDDGVESPALAHRADRLAQEPLQDCLAEANSWEHAFERWRGRADSLSDHPRAEAMWEELQAAFDGNDVESGRFWPLMDVARSQLVGS